MRDLQRPDAGVGHEAEGRLHADDAAVARRNADRAGLIAADRHRHFAGRDQRRAARRRAAGGVAVLSRILHRAGRARVAAAGHAVVFAHRLAGDLAALVEDAVDDGGVDVGHRALEEGSADHHRHAGEADVVLQRDAAAGELAAGLALDRGLHVPGAELVLVGRRPPAAVARIFHRGLFVGHRIERGIGRDQRRDDVLHGVEVHHARVHAELIRGVAQIGDAGFFESGHGGLRALSVMPGFMPGIHA